MERKQSELTVITKAKDLCSYVMTSTRLALTPVYLPYIDRISGVKDDCGVKSLRFIVIRMSLSGTLFKAWKCR